MSTIPDPIPGDTPEKLMVRTMVLPILCAVSPEIAAALASSPSDAQLLHRTARKWVESSVACRTYGADQCEAILRAMLALLIALKKDGKCLELGGIVVPDLNA